MVNGTITADCLNDGTDGPPSEVNGKETITGTEERATCAILYRIYTARTGCFSAETLRVVYIKR